MGERWERQALSGRPSQRPAPWATPQALSSSHTGWSHPPVPGCQAEAGRCEGWQGLALGKVKSDDPGSHSSQRGSFPPKLYEVSEVSIQKPDKDNKKIK